MAGTFSNADSGVFNGVDIDRVHMKRKSVSKATDNLTVAMEMVSPARAQHWLNRNPTNRKLYEDVVEKYMHDMTTGKWTSFGGVFVFYEGGDLCDGQHRLHAIVKANYSAPFVIVRGLTRSDGLNVDTGRSRTIIDAAHISGLDPDLSTQLLATARAISDGHAPGGSQSFADKLAVVAAHRGAAAWAVKSGPTGRFLRNSLVLGAMGRAYYHEKDLDRLAMFGAKLGSGMIEGESEWAITSIRQYLITNGGVCTRQVQWRDTFLRVQNAIHYFMRRKGLRQIKKVAEEAYPLILDEPAPSRTGGDKPRESALMFRAPSIAATLS